MADALVEKVVTLQKELRTKKSFVAACGSLTHLCEEAEALRETLAVAEAMAEAGKVTFTVLQTRFSNPKFWQAGLEFFLALEFHMPEQVPKASLWQEAAMQEVDEEAREKAKEQAKLRRLQEDKMHNKGLWSDANTSITQELLLAAQGMVLVEDEGRPGMSRDARDELRVVTVMEEELCVVCQEALPPGSKAKTMPCGHKFHDDCLLSWVKKSNTCPTCRFDEMPSEKRHFDDAQRNVQSSQPGRSGLYA
mmetsp:Transcript_167957/g.539448  ORF Transcript_167957/g.539448 Transcript_167957/m.539448 type:complete len:250 (-) Transcript_167957:40-789(-)|eukprot:CAMPEP_0203871838 /NCGR_PEP_ID=MMETSP0359-20131031/18941_1 /ASSEMBLY_ACC=CAM_ASM_000338 /TAXON_ID=268821 /ORGANISM="Scrippsiella Hangoei, Strain SHTV-5" /LENGTH=249 /DNA_ID=CAMNT_0050790515 /DNA_START=82 /DNA_END=831 /DNA_ORIENTATION=-